MTSAADLSAFVRRHPPARPPAPGAPLVDRVRGALGVPADDGTGDAGLRDVHVERSWRSAGVRGQELSWDPGFGARTRAWLLLPEGADEPLPAVLLAHCHGGLKRWGREKVAAGPGGVEPPSVRAARESGYGGRPVAEDLARRGFAVLAHDAFGWGSRRTAVDDMPPRVRELGADLAELAERRGRPWDAARRYEAMAGLHEHELAKQCGALGTSFAAMVLREDAAALGVLASRPEVDARRTAVLGFSGGGWRAGVLGALDPRCSAVGVVAMMSGIPETLEDHVHRHTWMFFTPGLWQVCDWPELAGSRAPRPLLVQYGLRDPLVPVEGARRAHEDLQQRYAAAGAASAYRGELHDVGHVFGPRQQAAAADWLAEVAGRAGERGAPGGRAARP
ncbi:hypothetical protein [uncultured Pseudokineococcus sp.]|uniref:hypothetical protein n=1 Tax=uncultured Pseudokineococcus sp. TaxID=1642928 RepID=UPI002623429F|nr:hypothetical protein [uncultured Pseudokineococcus sp.]